MEGSETRDLSQAHAMHILRSLVHDKALAHDVGREGGVHALGAKKRHFLGKN